MATAAAAMAAKARREVDEIFWNKDAFSPESAVEFEPRAPIQRRYLDQMIAEGVVHEAAPGLYWLDRDAFRQMKHDRMVWTFRIIGVGLAVTLVIWAITLLR